MAKAQDLEFGYKKDLTAPAIWGCRAIHTRPTAGRPGQVCVADVPFDRTSWLGEEKDRLALRKKLAGPRGAGAAFWKWAAKNVRPARGCDDATVGQESFKGVIFFYRAAGGYLYVAAAIQAEVSVPGAVEVPARAEPNVREYQVTVNVRVETDPDDPVALAPSHAARIVQRAVDCIQNDGYEPDVPGGDPASLRITASGIYSAK